MNKIIRAWVILMILFTSAAFAEKIEVNFRNCQPTTKLVGLLENRFGLYDTDIANLQSGDNLGTGNVYYVDSGVGSDTYDGTEPEWALATLDAAMAKCTANNGDRIYIIQSHGENEAVAAGTNFDVAGVIIVGLGEGDDMPEISLTAVGSTIQFAAADVTLKHVRILGNFTNGVTKAVNVLDAGDGYRIIDCEFKETSNTKELLIMVNVAADADRGLIYGCRFLGEAGGTDSSAVFFAGGSDKTIIANNDFIGDWSGYVIDGTTAASTEIMVVDDEADIRFILEKFLLKHGYDVITAQNGEEAIKRIMQEKSKPPQLVLLDIKMPGMDGLLALKKIKEIDKNIGVVMVSGQTDLEIAQKAIELGAYDYVMKPFNLEYLEMVVLTKLLLAE